MKELKIWKPEVGHTYKLTRKMQATKSSVNQPNTVLNGEFDFAILYKSELFAPKYGVKGFELVG